MAFRRTPAKGFRPAARIKGKLRHTREPSQNLEKELGITKAIPKEPMMPKGKPKHKMKPAISGKKKLRPLLGYV